MQDFNWCLFLRIQSKTHFKMREYHMWYFSSIQLLSGVRLFATPWTAACQASLPITNSQSLLKLMSIESVMPSQPSYPQLSPLEAWVESLASGQATRRKQPCPSTENWIKDLLSMAPPFRTRTSFPHSQSLQHLEASISLLLSLFIRGQTEWKAQSQKPNQTNHMDHSLACLTKWNCEPCCIGPPRTDRSWWRVL